MGMLAGAKIGTLKCDWEKWKDEDELNGGDVSIHTRHARGRTPTHAHSPPTTHTHTQIHTFSVSLLSCQRFHACTHTHVCARTHTYLHNHYCPDSVFMRASMLVQYVMNVRSCKREYTLSHIQRRTWICPDSKYTHTHILTHAPTQRRTWTCRGSAECPVCFSLPLSLRARSLSLSSRARARSLSLSRARALSLSIYTYIITACPQLVHNA
jgi:hypothetical protein